MLLAVPFHRIISLLVLVSWTWLLVFILFLLVLVSRKLQLRCGHDVIISDSRGVDMV